jgi:hypothetical protein
MPVISLRSAFIAFLVPSLLVATQTGSSVGFPDSAASTGAGRALEAEVGALRAILSGGSFQEMVGGFLGKDLAPSLLSETAQGSDRDVGIPAAVHQLERAVELAIGLLGRPSARDVRNSWKVSDLDRPVAQADATGSPPTFEAPALPTEVRRASLVISQALDRWLPSLRTTAARLPSSDTAAAQCDVHEELPFLCVSSEANNVHEADVALSIDLGGNDRYLNSAGGAPFVVSGIPQGFPVSINIDLGGDDVYHSRDVPEGSTEEGTDTLYAQGAAAANAVGILVDDEGDDEYRVTFRGRAGSGSGLFTGTNQILVQGFGRQGVGMLFDGSGADTYETEWLSGPGSGGYLRAQGAAVGGVGALIDRGSHPDSFVVEGGTAETTGRRYITGQGYGLGTAILFDETGAGLYRLHGAASVPPAAGTAEAPPLFSFCPGGGAESAGACVEGQGSANNGSTAMLLTGEGGSTYEMLVEGTGPVGFASAVGQVRAYTAGTAVLNDQGGNDAYEMRIEVSTDFTVDPSTIKLDDTGRIVADLARFGSYIHGQGMSLGGTKALLLDEGGNDRYVASNRQSVVANLAAGTSEDVLPSSFEVYSYPVNVAFAQANGDATLEDGGGDDVYIIEGMNSARGSSEDENVPVNVFTFGRPSAQGQASGRGASLRDLEGKDSFRAKAVATADAPEDARETVQVANGIGQGFFHGDPLGQFRAEGSQVTIKAEPARPVCPALSSPGHRGFGTWATSCTVTSLGSYGSAPSHTGVPVRVEWTPDNDFTIVEGAPHRFRARLVDAQGQPLAGENLRFTLMGFPTLLLEDPTGLALGPASGIEAWETHGTTGPDGVATGMLPTRRQLLRVGEVQADYRLFVRVTYDGDAGRYPYFLTQELTSAG